MTMIKVKGTAIPTYIVDDTVMPPPGAMVHRVLLPKRDRSTTLEELEESGEPIDQFLSEFFSAEER
jgi:hypothetical protein